MKIRKATALILNALLIFGSLPPVHAEVTMDQVREEIHKEMQSAPAAKSEETPKSVDQSKIDWASGNGIPIVKSPSGEMKINGYILARYLDQTPPNQTYQDHLGRTQNIKAANIISAPHRVLFSFSGWAYDPKFLYQTTFWTVQSTDKVAIIGYLAYAFSKKFTLFAGVGSLPGIRTMTYSHPYWLGSDRPMAEEFFRPGFTQGLWAQGELVPGFNYHVMIGNNLTTLNVNQSEDSRDFAYSGNIFWMPTTHEFGPKGGTGDFEHHDKIATRFGTGYTRGRQNASTSTSGSGQPDSTQIRMADSLLPFGQDSLVKGFNVDKVTYQMWSADAAIKRRGFFLQVQGFARQLNDFVQADGSGIPFPTILDTGFDLQLSHMIQPKKTELYFVTSYVHGDKDGGYHDSHEFIQGINRYLYGTKNNRLNLHIIEVNRSPASSVFGYYVGGQKGVTVSVGWSLNF